ncbi:hypothetical protein EDC01DRAFT_715702 [Geopyxis carbonaria]|nr:hypothetical protein EDC01DRAFT_715702 [Geopyxis carbonaria]
MAPPPAATAAPAEDDIAKRRTLFVRSLAYSVTSAALSEKFSFIAPIKHATVVADPATKASRGFGFVTFADAADAARAIAELQGAEFEGRKMKVELAERREREAKPARTGEDGEVVRPGREKREGKVVEEVKKRAPRLIVRNLPWSVRKPEQLVKIFQSFGKVKEVIIPKKRNGEMSGFAFVTMKGYKNAERAMEAANKVEIEGRPIAVDWAVEKSEWEAKTKEERGESPEGDALDSEGEGSGDEDDEEKEDDEEEGDEDEDEDAKADADAESDLDDDEKIPGEDEDDEDDEDADDAKTRPPTDSSTTLFIRNLPFTTDDDALFEHFSQFGPVRYCRTVTDHESGRPKGTGFVCFYDPEHALACLKEAPRDSLPTKANPSMLVDEATDARYLLDGRTLSITRAVERDEAARLTTISAKDREHANADKRRLYLLKEGTLANNAPGLSAADRLLREQSLDQRRKLLEADPNLHLSLTRLSIRNIPRWVTGKDLKAFARSAIPGFAADVNTGIRAPLSKEELHRDGMEGRDAEAARRAKGKGVVKQAKIQLEKINGRSRGYGFVEYYSHRYALMGLRFLNGFTVSGTPPTEAEAAAAAGDADEDAPKGKGKFKPKAVPAANARRATLDAPERKKRLIVEFALENAQVVNRRRANEERSKEISKQMKAAGTAGQKRKRADEAGEGDGGAGGKRGRGGEKGKKRRMWRRGRAGRRRRRGRGRRGGERKGGEKRTGGGKKDSAGEKSIKSKNERKADAGEKKRDVVHEKRMQRRAKKKGARAA